MQNSFTAQLKAIEVIVMDSDATVDQADSELSQGAGSGKRSFRSLRNYPSGKGGQLRRVATWIESGLRVRCRLGKDRVHSRSFPGVVRLPGREKFGTSLVAQKIGIAIDRNFFARHRHDHLQESHNGRHIVDVVHTAQIYPSAEIFYAVGLFRKRPVRDVRSIPFNKCLRASENRFVGDSDKGDG